MDYPYKEISDDETTWRTEGDKYLSNLLCGKYSNRGYKIIVSLFYEASVFMLF